MLGISPGHCVIAVYMCRFFIRVGLSLVVGLLAAGLRAQVAKDLPPGTTRDEVIRAYGWPTGRSSTANREILTFEKFQVILENDRVVNVSAMPPSKQVFKSRDVVPSPAQRERPGGNTTPASAGRPIAAPKSTPNTVSPRSTFTNPTPVARVPSSTTPVPLPSRPVVSPNSAANRPAPPPSSFSPWPYLIGLAVLVGAAIAVLALIARAARRPISHQPPDTQTDPGIHPKPTTWEQEVAGRLAKASPTAPPRQLTASLIRELEWKRLELLISLYFKATGIRAECTGIGADGGIDVLLFRPGEERPFSYVQCKAWGSELVGVSLMRELFGVMAADKVAEGVFVTTSDFTPDARTFGTANSITLITTRDLVDRFVKLPAEVRVRILNEITAGDYTTPTCPTCDRKMIWKEQPRFWGCPKFPVCRSSPIYPRAVKG